MEERIKKKKRAEVKEQNRYLKFGQSSNIVQWTSVCSISWFKSSISLQLSEIKPPLAKNGRKNEKREKGKR